MANEEQLSILKQGVEVWNEWRRNNPRTKIDLSEADLREENLPGIDFHSANLSKTSFMVANFWNARLNNADLQDANLREADLIYADLRKANLTGANLEAANLESTNLNRSKLNQASLINANLSRASIQQSQWAAAHVGNTIFVLNDLSEAKGLEFVTHSGPSALGVETIQYSKGAISDTFLRGCGLSDWQIEAAKLYNPEITNDAISKILYDIYDLRGSQAIQLSPLFISYSHGDHNFVDKVGECLTNMGIRYWRDVHEMKAGRIEKQIDMAIRQNPTVLVVLSEHSLNSDWVEHEVRAARDLAKELGRDTLCPVALDNSWKSSSWPKRVLEQIMEYNILDFSEWEDESRFDTMFRRLVDGLELFYKG